MTTQGRDNKVTTEVIKGIIKRRKTRTYRESRDDSEELSMRDLGVLLGLGVPQESREGEVYREVKGSSGDLREMSK